MLYEVITIIRTAIEKYRETRSLKRLIYSVLYTFIATIVFITLLILINKLKYTIKQRLEDRFKTLKKGIQIQSRNNFV